MSHLLEPTFAAAQILIFFRGGRAVLRGVIRAGLVIITVAVIVATGLIIIMILASVRVLAAKSSHALAVARCLEPKLEGLLARVRVRGDSYRVNPYYYRASPRRDRAINHAIKGALIASLTAALPLTRVRGSRESRQVAPSAAGMLAVVACLLPPADRARYAEEFTCELQELARSGAGRWRQVRYARSQLRSAPQMRFALRTPHRRSVAP
jgi:hypothetical protein